MSWTDIHSHILPGFDDGASCEEESLEMARVAVRGGTAVMAATPHYDPETPGFEPAEVAVAVEKLGAALKREGIALALVPGVEVRVSAGLFDIAVGDAERLAALTLGGVGMCMLLDLPTGDMPASTPEILYRVRLAGIRTVLAHPERNRYLVEHHQAARDLAEQGVEMQVDSGSIEGVFGRQARRAARRLLKEGAASVVASDAHGTRRRSTDLSGAATALERLMGKDGSRLLLDQNPRSMLSKG